MPALELDLGDIDAEQVEIAPRAPEASLEALLGGHAMGELAASCSVCSCCLVCCCCCYGP